MQRMPVRARTLAPLLLLSIWVAAPPAAAQGTVATPLSGGSVIDTSLTAAEAHDYVIRLRRGESAVLTVRQNGVDVVVELRGPDGRILDAVDSPTGRTGEERAEIMGGTGGTFGVRVRPYSPGEPAGRYRLSISEWRDARATARVLGQRARARDSAVAWLRSSAQPLRLDGLAQLRPLQQALQGARVVGLGEATHGSRELGDLRLGVTQHLVREHGFRLIAVEYSGVGLTLLNRWAHGMPVDEEERQRMVESGWIGRRPMRELAEWARTWNADHPGDRVTLVGLDAHGNARAQAIVRELLAGAYDESFVARFDSASAELGEADARAAVFGNSSVGQASHRTLLEVLARLDADAPMLAARFGADTTAAARRAARWLLQFADFNMAGPGNGRSRDWYMAVNLLDALESAPAGTRAVFWAHNAHVAISPERSPRNRTTGGYLREALGCGYRPFATSFGSGGFVAQRAADAGGRLLVASLPMAPEETLDGVMARVHDDAAFSAWPCGVENASVPGWLRDPRPMHWIGGIFDPDAPPTAAFQPFTLVRDFDGIFYLPAVTAEEPPAGWPPRRD
ncbi:MAG TPA: erythromycin esterase family protein [Longimicrobium sp.]|nr:erythromycin esterase family protein [Longimicrobium sp.]